MFIRKSAGVVVLISLCIIGTAVAVSRYNGEKIAYKIDDVEKYVNRVGPTMCKVIDEWQTKSNYPAWLCGPTSWWLANKLQKNFFPDLPIVTHRNRYGNRDCILFRAAHIHSKDARETGHCWIEIYYKGYMFWIDPTYGQFDKKYVILFAWFEESNEKEINTFRSILGIEYNKAFTAKEAQEMNAVRSFVHSHTPPEHWIAWSKWLDSKLKGLI